jgi:hypothetical protein
MDISDFIKIHDKSQFEIKLGYLINQALHKTEYKIEMYFFLPKNLKINKYTYTKKEFYEDFSSYIRLITPKENLKSLIDRLDTLQNFLESYKDVMDNHIEKINYELKIIICSYRAYIRDFSKSMGVNGNKDEEIRELINDINAFRKKVGKIREFAKYAKGVLLKNLFLFSDEYSSLVTEVYLFRLFNMLSGEIDANIIKKAIESEVNYRKKHNMSYIGENDEQNEDVIYRYSVFKKYFYSILFLFCKRQEDSVTLKHIFYAIAAGVAMIFATAIAFYFQQKYGNFTLSFFIALVISYMFKDRIKELFRNIFENRFLFKKSYDYKNKIFDPEIRTIFGIYKERVRFVDVAHVSNDVLDTRLKKAEGTLSTWYVGEDIIKYERKIILNNTKLSQAFIDKIEGINDIIRFNIRRFTDKMDDPTIRLHTLKDEAVRKVKVSKVYHVNVIIKFSSIDYCELNKVRLILTKKGIKRIELPEHDISLI